MHDAIGHTVRSLLHRPAFAGFSLALITLGVGASTAIFGVVHGTLLRPLPYPAPDDLYALSTDVPSSSGAAVSYPLSALELVRWRAQSPALEGIGGYTPVSVKLTGNGAPEVRPGMLVSADLIGLLGGRPAAGRLFRREEEAAGSAVAIISARLWASRFGRDPGVVGRSITIDDEPRQVIAILPASFSMLFQDCDVWMPLALTSDRLTGPLRSIAGVARVHRGSTITRAVAELSRVSLDLAQEAPDLYRNTKPAALSLRESLFGSQRTTLLLLLAAVMLLAVIGAVNVLGLVAADAVARRGATMTRIALGAGKRHVVGLRVREGAVLAAVALPLALLGGGALLAVVRGLNPTVAVDAAAILRPAVLGFAVVMALLLGVVTMLPSSFVEAALSVASLAGAAAKTAGSRAERLGRDTLTALQVAITVMLLALSAILTRDLAALMGHWPGFEAHGVLVAPLALSPVRYPGVAERAAHVERLLASIGQVPGVASVATIQTRFVLNETMQTAIEIDGHPSDPGVQQITNIRHVSPAVFTVLRTRVLAGRAIDQTDRAGSRMVAVVNRAFSTQYFGGESPVGRRIRRTNRADAPWMDIVGLVEDVSDAGIGTPAGATLYLPYLQQNTPTARVTIVARTTGDPARLAESVRRAIWQVDPDETIESATPLTALVSRSAAEPRERALLVTLFGAAGLLLVLTGIYATTQYAVLRRTRELGVRAALGAPPAALLRTTLAETLRPVLVGLAAGGIGVVWLDPLARAALGGSLDRADGPLLALVVIALVVLTLLAALVPARRAITISPTVAMRA